jgi:hypothetical protein
MIFGTVTAGIDSKYTDSKEYCRPSWRSRGSDREKRKQTKGRKKGVAGERIRRWGFPRGSFSFFCRNLVCRMSQHQTTCCLLDYFMHGDHLGYFL